MKIGVLILEDNPITAKDLSEIVEENNMEVLGVFYSGEEALSKVDSLKPDILLVDVQLKGEMTGIDFVNAQPNQVPVIYITANSDRETTREIIKTNPSAFLNKPYDEKNVAVAIELAFRNHMTKTLTEKQNNTFPFIFLKDADRFVRIATDDIQYLEAEGSYCKVCTKEKEYLLSGNLNQYGDLDHDFLRIHRSYIVNVKSITSIDSDYVFIQEKALPIGRVYKTNVKDLLKRTS